MHRKDLTERSPMRVFERSTHGGLGSGNVGVVASRPGVGKTPLLVQLGIDDLLHERRVLHVSIDHAVDRVRAYYDEIFHDLVTAARLEAPAWVKLELERKRLVYSLAGAGRGDASLLERIRDTVGFARDVAHFEPDVVLLDGFDFGAASEETVAALRAFAAERSVELWASVTVADAPAPGALPEPVGRLAPHFAVVVYLQSERELVTLRVLKDHDSDDVSGMQLRLDPHSMRVLDEDVHRGSDGPADPRRFRLHSGGARGAEYEFGACAERWGMAEANYSFAGHTLLERQRGVVVLDESELRKGDFSLVYVSRRLGRVLSEIPLVRSVLQTIWHQINAANQVFVVGVVQDDGTVRGGTGWGAELARVWKKPLFVYDQSKRVWFRWSGTAWEIAARPLITSQNFAGIGTQNLTDDGQTAIRQLFQRSFGDPAS